MKDPAFLFYPGDWNLGTMYFTLLEKGCYIELLMLQFSKEKFTISQAKHMLRDSFDVAWPTIKDKFETDGEFYWNDRLKKEKDKRKKFTQSRKDNANKGKKIVEHMENKDIIINDIDVINKYGKEMIESFQEYWNEKNKFGKRRWQFEKTFEQSKRLVRWKKNQDKFLSETKDAAPDRSTVDFKAKYANR